MESSATSLIVPTIIMRVTEDSRFINGLRSSPRQGS